MILKTNRVTGEHNSLTSWRNTGDPGKVFRSVFHPLPNLFRLLGLSPFKKAELTPSDFFSNKRPFSQKVRLPHAKSERPSQNGPENENEDSVSEFDLDNIVGVASSSELEEMDPPGNLLCELRPYQKQALCWMVQMEKGRSMDETSTTLHPCWEAYRLADKRELVVYLNAFSGEATTEFPSTLQMARGILADAMGLGKTIMTISLLLAHSGRGGGSLGSQAVNRSACCGEISFYNSLPLCLLDTLKVGMWFECCNVKICFVWSRWNKLIQKPFESGDQRGLKLVQSILKPIMLRRTKHSTDREGKKTISRQDLITAPTDSRFQIDIEKNWVESCKVTLLLNELDSLRLSGSKSIVFSQWTAFLDLLQIPFTRNKISFVRLDGTLNLQQREKVIKQFSEDSEIQRRPRR